MDADLRELRRRVERAPEDAPARLALGIGLARTGARADAGEALYIARALGAPSVRETLAMLRLPACPWGHSFVGDSRNSRWSPLAGPRRGMVVTSGTERHDGSVVVREDGSVVVTSGEQLAILDGPSLAVRARRGTEGADELAVGNGFVLTRGRERHQASVLSSVGDDGVVRIVDALSPESVPSPSSGAPTMSDVHLPPRIDASGLVLTCTRRGRAMLWSPTLELLETVECGENGHGPAFDGGRFALVLGQEQENQVAVLRAFELGRGLTFERPLEVFSNGSVAMDEAGLVYVVGAPGDAEGPFRERVVMAIDRAGVVVWRHSLGDAPSSALLAVRDGVCYCAAGKRLIRIENGRVAWSFEAARSLHHLVVDRHGVAYVGTGSPGALGGLARRRVALRDRRCGRDALAPRDRHTWSADRAPNRRLGP